MPGFTFEKISPPPRRKPAAPAVNEKPRGAIAQILERFVELRARRKLNAGTVISKRREPSRDDI
ncbi:MAG TPA: hypothetical protein VMU69_07085 [Bradyrhizobium sp.]|nr:hypothetical protein [Bradyrhizobium sp.]